MPLFVTVQTDFRASHSLGAPEHRRQELGEVCDVEHGHEYFLRATFQGDIDEVTGLLCSRADLSELLENRIRKPLHNKNLNGFLQQTSGEVIAKWCFDQLKSSKLKASLVRVELVETKKNAFTYPSL